MDSPIVLYTDIDAHVEDIVDQEKELNTSDTSHKKSTQRTANRLARDKALHIREKKIEFRKDPNSRQALLDWCADVANLTGKSSVDRYVVAGELLSPHKFLGGVDVGIKSLCAIASKKFTKSEMTAFHLFCIEQDKPLSEAKIHKWAFETYNKPMPPKMNTELGYRKNWTGRETIEQRLAVTPKLIGQSLLGIGTLNSPDMIQVMCRHYRQKFHTDKGTDVEVSRRILEAVEKILNASK